MTLMSGTLLLDNSPKRKPSPSHLSEELTEEACTPKLELSQTLEPALEELLTSLESLACQMMKLLESQAESSPILLPGPLANLRLEETQLFFLKE